MGHEEELRRELIERLLGPAVHRLNNSMAVVGGLAALLQQQELDPARQRHLAAVVEQAGEASDLIRELGRLPNAPSEELADVDLDAVLLPLTTLVRPACRSLRVEFESPYEAAVTGRAGASASEEARDAGPERGSALSADSRSGGRLAPLRAVRAPERALGEQLLALALELLPRDRELAAGGTLALGVEDAEDGVWIQLAHRAGPAAAVGGGGGLREVVLAGARRRAEDWGGALVESARTEEGREVRRLAWRVERVAGARASAGEGAGALGAEPVASRTARILVVEADAQLGSLIGDVLRDAGHEVEVRATAPSDSGSTEGAARGGSRADGGDAGSRGELGAVDPVRSAGPGSEAAAPGGRQGAWDLVLLDARSPRTVAEVARGLEVPVARMCGVAAEVDPGEVVLIKPFRPQELIEFVRAALATR